MNASALDRDKPAAAALIHVVTSQVDDDAKASGRIDRFTRDPPRTIGSRRRSEFPRRGDFRALGNQALLFGVNES